VTQVFKATPRQSERNLYILLVSLIGLSNIVKSAYNTEYLSYCIVCGAYITNFMAYLVETFRESDSRESQITTLLRFDLHHPAQALC
jgi:hypothetical protein